MVATITVLLALITFGAGLKAAWLWREASRSNADTVIINGVPAINPLATRELMKLFQRSAQKNDKAAVWTAWAAFLGASTTVRGTIAPIVERAVWPR
jgi:hypothetical protein